jgi:hypothetical protein
VAGRGALPQVRGDTAAFNTFLPHGSQLDVAGVVNGIEGVDLSVAEDAKCRTSENILRNDARNHMC